MAHIENHFLNGKELNTQMVLYIVTILHRTTAFTKEALKNPFLSMSLEVWNHLGVYEVKVYVALCREGFGGFRGLKKNEV